MENQKLSTRALSLPPSLSHINTPKMEKGGHSSTINIEGELTRREMKGKAPLLGGGEEVKGGYKRGIAIFDFVLRVCGIASALAATITMGTTDKTFPFFTQFLQFQASYDDLPTFTFFVIVNAIASAYLVLSIPFSIVCIVRPQAARPRLLLFIFDTVMVALTTAAAIVYLAHNGNPSANWLAICQQFTDFCQSVSGSVVASFISAVIFMFLILLSAFAL